MTCVQVTILHDIMKPPDIVSMDNRNNMSLIASHTSHSAKIPPLMVRLFSFVLSSSLIYLISK